MEAERIQEIYDRRAARYDQTIGFAERFAFGPLRVSFGAELQGDILEIGIGSGLNLPHYSPSVGRAVGVDLSRGMLLQARRRATESARPVGLVQADAEHLPFPAATFDTVAISLALCTVPNPDVALREMIRVCRPNGRLVLLEHVRSPIAPVDWMMRLLAPLQHRLFGCNLRRETIDTARSLGLAIESEQRRLGSIVRLVVARPPNADS